jgi:ABC-type nickel/cobalt efflux system permease component RcnA
VSPQSIRRRLDPLATGQHHLRKFRSYSLLCSDLAFDYSWADNMTSALIILAIGFFLGMRHATDPDHVVAVSTIVSRERSIPRAGWIGILWGVGHTITILIIGGAIILFGFAIPPKLGLALEFSVALMLILLGVLNLTGAMRWLSHELAPTHPARHGEHSHMHFHGARIHSHPHSHESGTEHHANEVDPPRWLQGPFKGLGWFHSLRPLFVGVVHGLAGSAAVALLVLGTIRNPRWAVFYLLLFGLGTIAGMMLLTLAFAAPFMLARNRFPWMSRAMVAGTGLLSLAFGAAVAYQIGFVDRLFSAHPSWTPH